MIAPDTSTWIAFLEGDRGTDTDLLDRPLADKLVVMVPVVLTELLSDRGLDANAAQTLAGLPLLEIRTGYWEQAGLLRAGVLATRRKARFGDALIAQTCVDHRTPLLTRNRDFRAFAEAADLRIAAEPRTVDALILRRTGLLMNSSARRRKDRFRPVPRQHAATAATAQNQPPGTWRFQAFPHPAGE